MPHDTKLLKRLQDAAEALVRLERGEAPSAMELAAAPQLDCWYRTNRHNVLALGGIVTGHPVLPDGGHGPTSALVGVAGAKRSARTVSRPYRLGPPLADRRSEER